MGFLFSFLNSDILKTSIAVYELHPLFSPFLALLPQQKTNTHGAAVLDRGMRQDRGRPGHMQGHLLVITLKGITFRFLI
jgi:hypothetical protein